MKRLRAIATLCLAAFGASLAAQTVNHLPHSANSATVTATIAPPVTIADEPYALYDALIRELRRGGFVIFMRHAAVLPASSDSKGGGEWWKNCAATQRLAPLAQAQAKAIGGALIAQRVSIDEVLTSEFCRAIDTGTLLGLGVPRKIDALNDVSAFVSQKRSVTDHAALLRANIASFPAAGRNRLLIGHALPATLAHPALSTLAEGDTAIFRPEGDNKFHLVATLTPGQWQWIGRQAVSEFNSAATSPPPPAPRPVIDPAKELKGIALVNALKKGGYNLYMRHGVATDGQDIPNLHATPKWWENCEIQRRLVEEGRMQAKKVGTALKQLNIPIAVVKASQFCRVRDTAMLMDLGTIEVTEDLNHQIGQRPGFDVNAARYAQLATIPPANRNVVMISHTHGSPRGEERVMSQMAEAEIVVFAPDGKGSAEPVARIALTEWDELIALAENAKADTKN